MENTDANTSTKKRIASSYEAQQNYEGMLAKNLFSIWYYELRNCIVKAWISTLTAKIGKKGTTLLAEITAL